MDADLRKLERAAATGDDDARARLRRAWQRAGRLPQDTAKWQPEDLRSFDEAVDRMTRGVFEGRWPVHAGYALQDVAFCDLPCEPHARFLPPWDVRPMMRTRELVKFTTRSWKCDRCGASLTWLRQESWQGPERAPKCMCSSGWFFDPAEQRARMKGYPRLTLLERPLRCRQPPDSAATRHLVRWRIIARDERGDLR